MKNAGCCIPCNQRFCDKAFHPECARRTNVYMVHQSTNVTFKDFLVISCSLEGCGALLRKTYTSLDQNLN